MVKRNIFIVAIIIISILFFFYYPTDKRRIKRTLKEIEIWMEKKEDLNPVGIAIKSKRAKDFFENECNLNFKDKWERSFNIEEIERGYYQIMTRVSFLKVKFKDIKINIDEKNVANVESAVFIVSKGENIEELSSINEIILKMAKKEKKWKIKEVKFAEILEK